MYMKLKYPLVAVAAILLTGCKSTGVIPMGQDSYMIGKKDGSPGLGVSLSNKAAVYREANAFCQAKGLEVMTLRCTTTPAMPGQLGSTELYFKCVPPGSTAQPLAGNSDRADAPSVADLSSTSTQSPLRNYTVEDFPIRAYQFDSMTKRGSVAVDIGDKGFQARLWVVKNIGMICSSKNIAMEAGKESFSGAKYTILDESIQSGLLTITFEATY